MTPLKTWARLVSLLSLLVIARPLAAQSIAPRAVNPPGSEADKAVELSPFVVNSSKDTGYQATSTLAGTRLNTSVKDIGSSISIYTKDFLNDIGATNASDLLIFATGMEAAGAGGNFSGTTNDINDTQVVGDGPRVNPQGSTRTRGLASPNFTRNFYTSDIPIDSYNTESVTVNRGPNSMLFGVGSPAGVVDTALLRPNLRRDANKVEARYGNNDSYRGVIDFNRVLVRDKLAVRLAALHDREEFNQRPAFEEKKRIYGALTFEPFKSTALRVNFETGNTRANRPITVLPFNSISPYWFEAGRPGYDWSFYDDPVRNPAAATQNSATGVGFLQAQAQFFDQIAVVYSNPSGRAADFGFRGNTLNTAANAGNAVKNQLLQPLVNRDLAADSIVFLGTLNVGEINGAFWTDSRVFPGQQPGFAPAGVKMQGFTDYSAFDFKNRMIDETSRQSDSFHAFNVALEQRAWRDRVGVELAYDTQRVDRRSKNSFFSQGNANHIRIDTNVTLPTGQPNPNLGRPYVIYGQSTWSNNYSDRETMRATGYLRYDFKDLGKSWTRWLGRHTATGLYEENAIETIGYSHRLAADGPAALAINPNVSVFGRRPGIFTYIGPSVIGNNAPLRLEPIRIPEIVAGPTAPARYFVRAANATDPGAFVDAPSSLVEISNNGSAQREVIKSQAAILQSYWLQDHLVTVFGRRRDEDFFQRQAIGFIANPADANDPGKVHWGFNDVSFARTPPPNAAKETKSYSAVLKWPQRLVALPRGTDLSVFYNSSENFTPVGGRVDIYNQGLPSPQGATKEYGVNVALFGDKLSLRVNRFETTVRGATSPPPSFSIAHNNATVQQAGNWGVEGNFNPENVPFMNAVIERLFSALPSDYRSLRDFRIVGTAPNLSPAFGQLNGITDTTDFLARGTEVELVYNPTRNWRILANIAKQETVRINSFPGFKEFMARMTPIWNSSVTDPRTGAVVRLRDIPRAGGYPTGTGPADGPPVGIQSFGSWLDSQVMVPFATALATEGSVSAEQRKWRFNVVTSYSFRRGSFLGETLDGWGIGAALRWQDKLGIGYPTTRKPDGSVTLDLAHPYYAPAEANVDAWISYERKLWKDRVRWKAQLNVRNLYSDPATIAIGVQPWGEASTVRLAPERRWYLTNTFSF
ncbi:MAG: TonB-dependent receptor plug domain-containing protein [Opitutaceae bacterium]|nr:TonB-dependent receptor plug domain-containing protein [Opitutaceae bacterium]